MKDKLKTWIKNYRISIIDPDGEGVTEGETELDEGEQNRLQLLNELEEFVEGL